MAEESELLIRMSPTPNPQAVKFVMNKPVKNEGKATFNSKEEAYGHILAFSLLELEGVNQVHMFENVITLTFAGEVDPHGKVDDVVSTIKTRYAVHDPNFTLGAEKKRKNRDDMSPEQQQIEEILDRTIRPGLQADGGDVEVVGLEGMRLEIRYEGACGTCPSSTMGTLQAIEGILQQEYSPEIEIILSDPVGYY